MDQMVLEVQKWLNTTYGKNERFVKVAEDGNTGWNTINGLIMGLQVELGIQELAPNFGNGTKAKFNEKYPSGIKQQNNDDKSKSNVYSIIQCALWCKGYSTRSSITNNFYAGTGDAIKRLKVDMGIGGDATVTIDVMNALLSMQQFSLLTAYGGRGVVRTIQKQINQTYKNYTGIIPCDGLYGREMNTALIQILQSLEGYAPGDATGNFGSGTINKLQKITKTNASSFGTWVWLAKAVLNCIKYENIQNNIWDNQFESTVSAFQNDYKIPVTKEIDVNTWMSLLTSKGNPNRGAKACDTRFEITTELLNKLKVDGYEIIGRYLTGGSFKEIREGELKRIITGGMKYFPIFQENGRELADFTYVKGLEHGKKASVSALDKGVPSTVIYFAVDMDIYDYQIDSNIIPYFRGINESIDSRYSVGIYASRNVCEKVSSVGHAVSSFVSDMSTGFSGNLGFPIPKNWNYDQFHEISGYGEKWDLDKVAYSGKIAACSTVNSKSTYSGSVFPKEVKITNINSTIYDVIKLIPRIEEIYAEYKKKSSESVPSVHIGVLNFLSKKYLVQEMFALSVMSFNDKFDVYFKERDSVVYNQINHLLQLEVSDTKIGKNDISHLAVTTLSYCGINLITPMSWVGWAGDLATGMRTLNKYMSKHPNLDVKKAALSIIGADIDYPSDYLVSNGVNMKSLGNECNFTDFCDDADAIGISRIMSRGTSVTSNLSKALNEYYTNLTQVSRYSQYKHDGLDFTNIEKLTETVKSTMNHSFTNAPKFGLNKLKGNSTKEEQDACCSAFAYYLMRKL